MNLIPEPSQLHSREEAIRIAARYPEGLKAGSFVRADTPFASSAYTLENGRLVAGSENLRTQQIPALPETTYQIAAVDEDLGIVWIRQELGSGSAAGASSTHVMWEAIKVYGGEIHAVETFTRISPADVPSGLKH